MARVGGWITGAGASRVTSNRLRWICLVFIPLGISVTILGSVTEQLPIGGSLGLGQGLASSRRTDEELAGTLEHDGAVQPTSPRLPPSLSHFVIFSPALRPSKAESSKPTDQDLTEERDMDLEDDLREAAQIPFYTSREASGISRDRMLRQVTNLLRFGRRARGNSRRRGISFLLFFALFLA